MSFDKPADLIDRERAWATLTQQYERTGPSLVLMLGRRRVGKSWLLTRFAQATRGLYYQATRMTEREQLRSLSLALAAHFDDAALRHTAFSRWDDLLAYVAERTQVQPFVLILDEFPYLADSAPALPSVLQKWWDHDLPATSVKLILSGSHITAMRRLEGGDQPLYGRRTARIDLLPFDYADAAQVVPKWSAKDRLHLYGMVGGLPGHLALVDPVQSLAENIGALMLEGSGRLYDEAIHAFDAFLPDASVHYSIIDAIANGEQTWSRIASRVGKQTSALSRPLEWLLEMGVVRRVAPLTAYPKPSPKRVLYQIADPYLAFWHRFIADIRGRGLPALVAPEQLWETMIAPRLDDYMGGVFEAACRQFVARSTSSLLPFRPVQVGAWWSRDGSAEVDVVALGSAGELLVGECKWGMVDERDLMRLQQRGQQVAREAGVDVSLVQHVLFTAGIPSEGLSERATAGAATLVSAKHLYQGHTT
ncbi:MAG: ATP-binding protein [Rhodothermales bacterium]